MKIILPILLLCLIFSGCSSRKGISTGFNQVSTTDTDDIQQDSQDDDELDSNELDEDGELDENDEDDIEEKSDIEQYKIYETGFGIEMAEGWEIAKLPDPMGISITKGGMLTNSGSIQILSGDSKKQQETDFPTHFDSMGNDPEILHFIPTNSETDGLYRVEVDYESTDEKNGVTLHRLVYQEVSDTELIFATFLFKPDAKDEARGIAKSISKLTTSEPLEPELRDSYS